MEDTWHRAVLTDPMGSILNVGHFFLEMWGSFFDYV